MADGLLQTRLDTRRQIVKNAASKIIEIPLDVLCESENSLSDYVIAGMVSSFSWFFFEVFLLSDS